ncbi:efflux RND transporter periplasmic adaptor subunit [Dyella amyloliquefaciens]|uniref:efflux RND transporter periplasmic adaptor subunit n=1 Tax=Dyella amyloliquefaciens TaxID=1770545 RepID=UPI00102EC17A|nr:efflux RND transporter periplasmic adaptor subunit [Dyella amyloliquefaciens]
MRRWFAGLGLASLVVTAALAAEPVVAIPTARAARVDRVPLDQLPATVKLPLEGTAVVVTPLGGIALEVLVREGDTVKRGQVFARLQSREAMTLAADLSAAQGAYRVAAAQAGRDEQLLKEGIVPESRLQASVASRDATAARVRELQAARAWAPAASGSGMGVYELRAPMDGRVIERAMQPGGTYDALAKAFVVVAGQRVMLELRVPASFATQVRRGQEVRTREGAIAKVSETGGALDVASQTVLVRAEGEAGSLLPGMQTSATLWLPAPQDAVSVPSGALLGEGGAALVFMRTATGFRAVDVTVLARDGESRRTVRGGLKHGDEVATGMLDTLRARTSTEGQ